MQTLQKISTQLQQKTNVKVSPFDVFYVFGVDDPVQNNQPNSVPQSQPAVQPQPLQPQPLQPQPLQPQPFQLPPSSFQFNFHGEILVFSFWTENGSVHTDSQGFPLYIALSRAGRYFFYNPRLQQVSDDLNYIIHHI